jgi:hypothetical protein
MSMKKDWSERAKQDPMYYTVTDPNCTEVTERTRLVKWIRDTIFVGVKE